MLEINIRSCPSIYFTGSYLPLYKAIGYSLLYCLLLVKLLLISNEFYGSLQYCQPAHVHISLILSAIAHIVLCMKHAKYLLLYAAH